MPKIDASLTITGIIALCAILSPVIVTFLNNRHAIKMEKLKFQTENKAKAIEDYLLAVGKILDVYSSQSACDYEARKGIAYLYAPKSAWPKMDELDRLIKGQKFEDARKSLVPLCKELSKATD